MWMRPLTFYCAYNNLAIKWKVRDTNSCNEALDLYSHDKDGGGSIPVRLPKVYESVSL